MKETYLLSVLYDFAENGNLDKEITKTVGKRPFDSFVSVEGRIRQLEYQFDDRVKAFSAVKKLKVLDELLDAVTLIHRNESGQERFIRKSTIFGKSRR